MSHSRRDDGGAVQVCRDDPKGRRWVDWSPVRQTVTEKNK